MNIPQSNLIQSKTKNSKNNQTQTYIYIYLKKTFYKQHRPKKDRYMIIKYNLVVVNKC